MKNIFRKFEGPNRQSVGWKIYFGWMTFIYIICLLSNLPHGSFWNWADILINTLTWTALLGFVFNKKILFKKFWQMVFYFTLSIEAFNMGRHFQDMFQNSVTVFFTLIWFSLILVPIYLAVYLYAYQSDAFWEAP